MQSRLKVLQTTDMEDNSRVLAYEAERKELATELDTHGKGGNPIFGSRHTLDSILGEGDWIGLVFFLQIGCAGLGTAAIASTHGLLWLTALLAGGGGLAVALAVNVVCVFALAWGGRFAARSLYAWFVLTTAIALGVWQFVFNRWVHTIAAAAAWVGVGAVAATIMRVSIKRRQSREALSEEVLAAMQRIPEYPQEVMRAVQAVVCRHGDLRVEVVHPELASLRGELAPLLSAADEALLACLEKAGGLAGVYRLLAASKGIHGFHFASQESPGINQENQAQVAELLGRLQIPPGFGHEGRANDTSERVRVLDAFNAGLKEFRHVACAFVEASTTVRELRVSRILGAAKGRSSSSVLKDATAALRDLAAAFDEIERTFHP